MSNILDTVKHATAHDTVRKMPSVSQPQARLMAAAAHTPGGYGGVPQSVGRDFNKADTGSTMLKQAMANRNAQQSMKARGGGNPALAKNVQGMLVKSGYPDTTPVTIGRRGGR